MRYDTVITGLPVTAEYSDIFISETAVPLLKKWSDMYAETGKRVIVFLAAPPGAGKSTMADMFMKLSMTTPGIESFTSIGMDGFHHYQDYLLSHYTERDGEKICMVDIKGAPITFDLEGLTKRIRQLAKEDTVPWPVYDRTAHNPQDNAIIVKENVVLIEGNYLLLNEAGWDELRKYASMTLFIKANPEVLRKRLIERKFATCNDIEKAEKFVDFSDMINVKTCLENRSEPDIMINMTDSGDYKVIKIPD